MLAVSGSPVPAETFTKQGVRYRFFKTHPNRYGDGKVHLQRWHGKPYRQWVLLCKPSDLGMDFGGYFGTELDTAEIVTCKRCIKLDPRP